MSLQRGVLIKHATKSGLTQSTRQIRAQYWLVLVLLSFLTWRDRWVDEEKVETAIIIRDVPWSQWFVALESSHMT